MLQRTSLPATTTSELAETLQRTLERRQVQTLQNILRLPATWRQYLVLLAGLLIVAGGMMLQVTLAVQIAEAELQVAELRDTYERIERQNSKLVYEIATRSSLEVMQQLATGQGYVPATGRTYVFRDQLPSLAVAITASKNGRAPVTDAGQANTRVRTGQVVAGHPPGWLEQGQQWAGDAQASAQATLGQFVRDVMGRVQ